jgi:DNA-directed RNA polymerase subunit RPC12/RpoP
MPSGVYERPEKAFVCTRCGKTYTTRTEPKGVGHCKQCNMIVKVEKKRKKIPGLYLKYNRRTARRKAEEVGNKCAICSTPLLYDDKTNKPLKRFIRHHVCYSPEKLVLLCFSCHSWLHGLCGVYANPLKKKYSKDVAPYEFAKRVVDIYMDNHPMMREIVMVNLNDLSECVAKDLSEERP